MAHIGSCGICGEEVCDNLVCQECAQAAGELVILGQKPTKEMVLFRRGVNDSNESKEEKLLAFKHLREVDQSPRSGGFLGG